MARKTRVLGFSVEAQTAEEFERLAQLQNKSKSELFREMIDIYKAKLKEEEFFQLQRRMAKRARRTGRRLTEQEVERIVFEGR